jgi:proteasome lid subunit RPN8/RPN11
MMDARITAAVDAARLTPQREICGVFTDDEFIRMLNLATDHREFVFDEREYAKINATKKVRAIVHSHPGNVTPSRADVESCNDTALPWCIVNGMGHHVWLHPSRKAAPLFGRPFQPKVFDCATICRDYFSEILGIEVKLPHYEVEFWKEENDLLNQEFVSLGFRKTKVFDIKKHDVLVFIMNGSTVPNHLAIYLGDGLMLEQRRYKASSVEVLTDALRDRLCFALRHESLT